MSIIQTSAMYFVVLKLSTLVIHTRGIFIVFVDELIINYKLMGRENNI